MIIAATGHSFGAYTTSVAPTCTQQGLEKQVCSSCGKENYRQLAAKGHSFGAYTLIQAPTCTKQGIEEAKCSVCSVSVFRYIQALGHHFGGWTVTKPPSCTEAGVQTRICSSCGKTETQTLKKLAHTLDGGWYLSKEASLKEPGRKVRYCSVCKKVAAVRDVIPKGYRYNMQANGFGPYVYQLNPTQIANTNRLIPLTAQDQEVTYPIISHDGYDIGKITLKLVDGIVTAIFVPNDPNTVLVSGGYTVYSTYQEALSAPQAGPRVSFGSPFPANSNQCIVSVEAVINYDQNNSANQVFSDSTSYVNGMNLASDVMANMLQKLININGQ
jgi:ribosomal protein L32